MRKITVTEKILKRPVTVFMISLMVIGFGLFSLSNLRITLMPSFEIPVMAVSVNYQNVAPEDMLRMVVRPIEGAAMGVEGIESLESNVRNGGAFIILRLNPGTDIDKTDLKLREALDRIRASLPAEANEPVIFQFDPDRAPIMEISVESSVLGLDELRNIAEEFIEPRFERLYGVASADTRGGFRRNFYVSMDTEAMARHRVVPSDVSSALNSSNIRQPIGNLITERLSYSVRAQTSFRSIEEIGQTVIRLNEDDTVLRVSDVATVENTYADVNSIVEVNGQNSVTVRVQRQSDANTLEVAQAVIQEIEKFRDLLPENVSLQILSNEGKFIQESINNLAQSALIALIVVVLILLLFMGGWRIAFVVAMSIPVSITATFAAMYFADISLNIISITGLALAIGLLVDNSIVVSESIANKLEEGQNRFQATLSGTNEVAGALLGSTLTTLAVFVPILAVSGITGTVTRDLALTISIAITSSYLASIILIPVLASLVMRREKFEKGGFIFKGFRSLEKNYGQILFWILRRKYVVGISIIAILAGSVYLFRTIPGEFFPETDTGEFSVQLTFPAGTPLTHTATEVREFAGQVLSLPEVRIVIAGLGEQRRSTDSNLGELNILLTDVRDRRKSATDIMAEVEEMLQQPEVDINVMGGAGGPAGLGFVGRSGAWGGGGGTLQFSLVGPDIEVLQEAFHRIEDYLLEEDDQIAAVNSQRSRPSTELHYFPEREQISRIGATTMQVASAYGAQVRGGRAGFFMDGGREIPIEVRTDQERIQNRQDLFALDILQIEEQRVPITALGNFDFVEGVGNITRRDRETILDVSVRTLGDVIELEQTLPVLLSEQLPLPDGYRYDFETARRTMDESSRQLGFAALMALLLTYMVMASLFENLRDPIIIMFTVPLAFFGSLLFLFATMTPLSVPAYIGIVLLVGIVVNNGIVLVDYIHQYTGSRNLQDGRSYLILFLRACKRRLRPILLTAMTTVFSMIPLALEIGAGAETWSPLAKSVIGGLSFATILTLFVVPAVVVGISKARREWVEEGLKAINH
ncbi:MAG: efflux RND transporter permease subunit [Balneolaceae bacterium]